MLVYEETTTYSFSKHILNGNPFGSDCERESK